MRLRPWRRKKHEEDVEAHSEAKHALVRAIEDKHEAEAKWLPVAHVTAHIHYEAERNGFGEDLKVAFKAKRG